MKRPRPKLFPAIALCAAFLAAGACSRPQQAAQGPETKVVDNAAAPADNAAAAAGTSKTLFIINGTPVDEKEFRTFIEAIASDDAKMGSRAVPGMVDTFINNRLLAALAQKEKLDAAPGVRSRLEVMGNSLWRDVYWAEVVKPKLRIAEKDLLARAPRMEDMVSLQQLTVGSRDEAERFRERAVGGEDFGKIIREHSIGLTARNDGNVGYVNAQSQMYDPKTLDSLFRMKAGEYTPVFEMPVGFVVIRVLERKPADQFRKDWLKENRDRVVKDMEKKRWEESLDALVRSHKVVVNRKTIDAYTKARSEKAPLDALMKKVAFKIDGVPFTLADLTDPSGTGVIHGEQTMNMIVNSRLEDFALSRDLEKRGLKEKHPDVALREKLFREAFLAREYIAFKGRNLKVGKEEIRRYYEERKAKFVSPRALDVSLIETRSKDRVGKIYEELGRGASFEEVSDRWNDNKSYKGGRIGFVPENSITADFAAVKTLKVGEYAKEPIRLRAAKEGVDLYVVAKMNAVREQRPIPFEEIDRSGPEKAIMAQKREELVMSILVELRKANKVEFAPAYQAFASGFGNNSPHKGGGR